MLSQQAQETMLWSVVSCVVVECIAFLSIPFNFEQSTQLAKGVLPCIVSSVSLRTVCILCICVWFVEYHLFFSGVAVSLFASFQKALAYHGKALGIPVTVVMPVNAPITKVSRSKGFGATVMTHGAHIGQSKEYAMEEFGHLEYINGENAFFSFLFSLSSLIVLL